MTGPAGHIGGPRNILAEVENALTSRDGWASLKRDFLPAVVADSFRPGDDILVELARYAETIEGRKVLTWLHELTDRAPYPVGTMTIEETAIAAARHQGRAGVGHVISKAVAEGSRLRDQTKG